MVSQTVLLIYRLCIPCVCWLPRYPMATCCSPRLLTPTLSYAINYVAISYGYMLGYLYSTYACIAVLNSIIKYMTTLAGFRTFPAGQACKTKLKVYTALTWLMWTPAWLVYRQEIRGPGCHMHGDSLQLAVAIAVAIAVAGDHLGHCILVMPWCGLCCIWCMPFFIHLCVQLANHMHTERNSESLILAI